MHEEPSVEELITQFISIEQEDVERSFQKGEIAYYLLQMGYTNNSLGSQVKRSGEYIRVLVKTFEAFPKPEDRRYPELEFYHYRLAAKADDPHHWLEQASENEWSTRELSKAMKNEPVEDDYREAEQLLFKVKTMLSDEAVGPWFREKLQTLLCREPKEDKQVLSKC